MAVRAHPNPSQPWLADFDVVIERTRGLRRALRIDELWAYRELLYFFTWRDVKVRYKQTAFGFAWAVLQPLTSMFLFTIIFSNVVKVGSEGIPYAVFSYTALVPWYFFANAVQLSSGNLVSSANMVTKVYFPRVFLALSPVAAGAFDLVIALAILFVLMPIYSVGPSPWALLVVPALVALTAATSAGIGSWLAALNVRYRDVRYVVPFLIQFWFFATPVVYPITRLGEPWRTIYGLNPMAGVVEGFRWALVGGPAPSLVTMLLSAVMGIAMLIGGLLYFGRTERTFADVI
jgi:homopolymeric O-antigen transport system permease protein